MNLVRREGGAKLVPGEVVAPPISILSTLMKRWRAAAAASPATPTAAGSPGDKGPTRKAA